MDARQRRSREKLRSALFELASVQPASELTVSQLATLAGVNRSTFYEHASSPQALLEELLRSELDELRQTYLADISPAEEGRAIAGVTRAVLQHIDEHAAIYRFGLSEESGASSLHAMLSAHFEASIRMLVDADAVLIRDDAVVGADGARGTGGMGDVGDVGTSGSAADGSGVSGAPASDNAATGDPVGAADAPGIPAPSLPDYAARYIASGTVGLITVWLGAPEPRDVDAVLHAYWQLLPGWWPAA